MINILYIGNLASIHDLKWIQSIKREGETNCFVMSEFSVEEDATQVLNSLNIKFVGELPPFSLLNWIKNYRTFRLLRNLFNKHSIDLVHVFIGTSQVILPSFLSVPVVLTTRGTDVNYTLKRLSESNYFREKVLFKILSSSYRRITQITSTSLTQINIIDCLIPDLKKRPLLIRTGVDIDGVVAARKHDFGVDRKIVLFIRNIHKNYDPLLSVNAVVALSSKTLKETFFVFMKGANYDEDLFGQMKVILDHKKVFYSFLDPMSNLQVWSVIKAADLVVMNPLTDGTPNTAIESMAANKKLIMGYCDYDKDLFNLKTAVFLPKRSSFLLSDLIEEVLYSKDDSKVENAFLNIQELASQKREMRKVFELYITILNEENN